VSRLTEFAQAIISNTVGNLLSAAIVVAISAFLVAKVNAAYGIAICLAALILWVPWRHAALLWRLRHLGIEDVLVSLTEGRGSTEAILATVRSGFAFMGISAKRWIDEEKELRIALKSVAAHNNEVARFLVLDPKAPATTALSRTAHENPQTIPDHIHDTIKRLADLAERSGLRIELRVYSSVPILRIAIIDSRTCYLGFYTDGRFGEESGQLVLAKDKHGTCFNAFSSYFESVWKKSVIIPLTSERNGS